MPNKPVGADRPSCFFAPDINTCGVPNGSTTGALCQETLMNGFKLIKYLLIGAIMITTPSNGEPPPVDVNKPVTNQALKKAIADRYKANNEDTNAHLIDELKKANYLIPIITDEMKTGPVSPDGKTTIQKDSLIKVLNAVTADGKSMLAAFTDWEEIRQWTDQSVSTLVMPLSDLVFMGLGDSYEGVVINPAGKAWIMDKNVLKSFSNKPK